jgi:hypothetical protein
MNYQTIVLQPTLPQSLFTTLKTPNLIKNGKAHYILGYTQISKCTICNLVHLRNKLNDAKLIILQTTKYTYINFLCILMNIQLSELTYTNLTYPHIQFMPILQRQHNLTQNHTALWQILHAEMFKFSFFLADHLRSKLIHIHAIDEATLDSC